MNGRTLAVLCVAVLPCACRRESSARERGPEPASVARGAEGSSGSVPSGRAAPVAVGASSAPSRCSPPCASIERCEGRQCVGACPDGEVFIPATGPDGFVMGRGRKHEKDQAHRVVLTRPFCMDATEVTVEAFRRCVASGSCTEPQLRDANSNYRPELKRPKHPVNMVNWKQAVAYCDSRHQRLPTEAQWEWAASRGDGRTYPWGNAPEPTCENGYADFTPGGSPKSDPAGDVGCHGGGSSEVRAHPNGKVSWPGGDLFDMGGNVWEWTADCYLPYPDSATDPHPTEHPSLEGSCYVYSLRGGGWNRSNTALQTFWRAASKWTYRVPGLGFRCVRDPVE